MHSEHGWNIGERRKNIVLLFICGTVSRAYQCSSQLEITHIYYILNDHHKAMIDNVDFFIPQKGDKTFSESKDTSLPWGASKSMSLSLYNSSI